MIGNVRIGVSTTGSSGGRVSMRVMHMSRGTPFISAEHDPHLPALQFHLQARSGAGPAWTRCTTSKTTSPSCAGSEYSTKSPPLESPRQILRVTSALEAISEHPPVERPAPVASPDGFAG